MSPVRDIGASATTVAAASEQRGCALADLTAREDVVDAIEPASWPADLRTPVQELAECTGPANSVVDLQSPDDADDRVRSCLGGRSLLAFHATRLLDHERETIKAAGLRVHERELFDDKVRAAYDHGAVTEEQRDALLMSHMCTGAEPNWRKRKKEVCVVLGRCAFDDHADGVYPLLSSWGGEGIYYATETAHMKSELQRLGAPTIVVVAIPVAESWREQFCAPDLGRLLIGSFVGMMSYADMFHHAAVPPQDVLAIWQPGHPEYDAHAGLPRS